MNNTSPRVVMVGLPGMGESVLRAWSTSGRMPRLAAILARSASGAIRSSQPAGSAVAWCGMITGRTVPNHGIYDRDFLEPLQGEVFRVSAQRLRSSDLWSLIRNSGETWSSGSGDILSFDTKRIWTQRPKSISEVESLTNRQCSAIRKCAAAFESADAHSGWKLLSIRLRCVTGLQQFLWPELETGPSLEGARTEWIDAVDRIVAALDETLGRIAELAQRRGAALLLYSENSHGPCRSLVNLNGILRIHGIQKPSGQTGRFVNRSRRRLVRLRKWSARRILGRSGDTVGVPLTIRNDCDWSRTLAYAPFGEDAGLIYLTTKARRHNGRSERVTLEIAEIFRLIADPSTGDPIFSDVIPVGPRWNIDPVETGWPEIIAVPANGYRPLSHWRFKEKARIFRPDSNRPACVYDHGFVAVSSSKVPAEFRITGRVVDLAPTVLDHLDLAVPEFMEGTPIGRPANQPLYHPHIRPDGQRTWAFPESAIRIDRFPIP